MLKASSEAAGFSCTSVSGMEGSGGSRQPPFQTGTPPSKACGSSGTRSCSPLQRAAWGAAAATREGGQPAVPHRPFPSPRGNKATPKIRAPAGPAAPVQRRPPRLRALLGSVWGQGGNKSRLKAPEAPTVSWCPHMSALGGRWDRWRANTRVLQTHPEPAACTHGGTGSPAGGDGSTSLPGQHASPVPFCTARASQQLEMEK